MYTRDKQDGSSKEGSGRVAMYTRPQESYTGVCNMYKYMLHTKTTTQICVVVFSSISN